MFSERVLHGEALAALRTLKWLLARVRPNVAQQRAAEIESFAAAGTDLVFGSHAVVMLLYMGFQSSCISESLITNVACVCKAMFTCHVTLKVVLIQELAVAFVAIKRQLLKQAMRLPLHQMPAVFIKIGEVHLTLGAVGAILRPRMCVLHVSVVTALVLE